jgi:LPXTG-motif cell wall-anchored protein
MKPQSKLASKSRAAFVALSGVALAIGLTAVSAQADQWDKKTTLTIDQPMQVRDTLLQPGQYVFKLLDSSSNRNIVQIYNADQTHLINTVMAVPDYRVQPTGSSRFVMWETPEGSAKALKEWFYPGDNFGQEFPYPKHLTVIAQASNSTYLPPPSAAPAPAEPAPQPQASVQEPPESAQQPVEIAQNSPPPPPPAPSAAPEPSPQPPAASTPAELPKTASPYPMIGFSGLLLLGVGGLLRRAHSA